MTEIFEIYYKPKKTSRKWQKASLSMKDFDACADCAKQLMSQEKWDSVYIAKRTSPNFPLKSFYCMGVLNA